MKKFTFLLGSLFMLMGGAAWADINPENLIRVPVTHSSQIYDGMQITIRSNVSTDRYFKREGINNNPDIWIAANSGDDLKHYCCWTLRVQDANAKTLKYALESSHEVDGAKYASVTSNGTNLTVTSSPVYFELVQIGNGDNAGFAFKHTDDNGDASYLKSGGANYWNTSASNEEPFEINQAECWTLQQVISEPAGRATSLTNGGYYLIYNACSTGDHGRFFIFDNGSNLGSTAPNGYINFVLEDLKYVWKVEEQTDGTYYLKNVSTGKYVDINGATSTNAQSLVITNGANYTGTIGGETLNPEGTGVSGYKGNDIFVVTSSTDGSSGNNWTSNADHTFRTDTWAPQAQAFYAVPEAVVEYLYYVDMMDLIAEAEATMNTTALGYPQAGTQAYTDLQSAVATAKTYTATTTTAEAVQALQAAFDAFLNSDNYSTPQSGKTYMFVNAKAEFDGKNAMISDGADLRWEAKDLSKNNNYWILEATDGGFNVKNGDGTYIAANGSDFFVSTTEKATTEFTRIARNSWRITIDGNDDAHANNHGDGWAASNIIAWPGGEGEHDGPSAWKIEPISDTDYNIYTVTTTAPEGKELPVVTRTATGEVAGNGGFFILPVGETFKTDGSDFTGGEEGYHVVITVDNEARTIKLEESFNKTEYAAELKEHATNAEAKLNTRGVGYPNEGGAAYNALSTAIQTARNAADNVSALTGNEIDELKEKEEAYLKTTENIQMPVDGKAYNIKVVFSTGVEWPLYFNGTRITASNESKITDQDSKVFICRVVDGKFVFVNGAGKYMLWCDSGDANKSYDKNGYSDEYLADWNGLTIGSVNALANHNSADNFGRVYIQGLGYTDRNNGVTAQYYLSPRFDGEDAISTFIAGNNVDFWYDAAGENSGQVRSSMFLIEEVSYPNTPALKNIESVNMAVGTFSAPFPTVVPDEVKAYYVAADAINSTTAKLTRIPEGEVIPANQGVILAAAKDAESALMVPATSEAQSDLTGNLLKPSGDGFAKGAYTDANSTVYVLSGHENKVAFYLAGANTSLGANKAYLEITGGAAAPSLVMNFGGETTGIESIVTESADKAVYDLSGRRIQNPTKGLYIIGGKKVYIK